MFKWIKSLFSKPSVDRCLYRCTYVLNASIEGMAVSFSLEDMHDIYVVADSMLEAQVELAKKIPLSPHIYIHKIEKAIEVSS